MHWYPKRHRWDMINSAWLITAADDVLQCKQLQVQTYKQQIIQPAASRFVILISTKLARTMHTQTLKTPYAPLPRFHIFKIDSNEVQQPTGRFSAILANWLSRTTPSKSALLPRRRRTVCNDVRRKTRSWIVKSQQKIVNIEITKGISEKKLTCLENWQYFMQYQR